jgi:hypothetical protein
VEQGNPPDVRPTGGMPKRKTGGNMAFAFLGK